MRDVGDTSKVSSWEKILPILFFPLLLFFSSRAIVLIDLAARPQKLFVIAVLLLVSFLFLLSKKGIFHFGRFKIPLILFTLFVGINLASIDWAFNAGLAIQTSIELFLLLMAVVCSKLMYNYFGKTAIHGMALAVAFVSVVFIVTSFQDIVPSYMDRISDETIFIKGIAGHRNLLSIYCYLLCIASVGLSRFYSGIVRVVLLVIIPIALLVIVFFSLVRLLTVTSVGALLLLMLCYFLFKRSKFNPRILLLPVLLVAALSVSFYFIGSEQLQRRFSPSKIMASHSFVERQFWWGQSLQIIEDNFWLGCGSGNWKLVVDGVEVLEKDHYRLHKRFRTPHNDYLMIFAETGVISLSIYLLFWLCIIHGAFRYYNHEKDQNENAWLIIFAALATAGGILIFSILYAPRACVDQLVIALVFSVFLFDRKEKLKSTAVSKIATFLLLPFLLTSIYCLDSWKKSKENLKEVYSFTSKAKWNEAIDLARTVETPMYQLTATDQPVETTICISYNALKEYDKAKESCKRAIEINPYDPKAHAYMGFFYRLEKDYDTALEYYREAVRLNPNSELYKMRLAEVLIDCDLISESLDWLEGGEKFMKLREVMCRRIEKWYERREREKAPKKKTRRRKRVRK